MRRLFLTLCLVLAAVAAARADITPDNSFDFLRRGDLKVGFTIQTKDIDWVEDAAEFAEHTARLEAILTRNPRNVGAAAALIALYDRGCRETEAKEVAKRTLPAFRTRLDRDRNETSALGYARAVLAAEAREAYGAAYRALQPFLESGQAGPETCTTAIAISMAANQYGLAKRLADSCLRIHPRCAELYYHRFLISVADMLYASIVGIAQDSAQELLEEAGPEKFITGLLKILNSEIDTPALLRAIELQPWSYQYNLTAASFEAVTLIISKAALQFLWEDIGGTNLEDLLLRTGTAVLSPLRDHLAWAEAGRPPRDIQVFLVRVAAAICLGDYGTAEYYALMAVGARPDLPAGYDALIMNTYAPFMRDGDFPDAEARSMAIAIYEAKITQTGETAADYHELAKLYFSEYGEGKDGAGSPLLEKAEEYAELALTSDPSFVPARLLLALIRIVNREYRRAIAILEEIPEPEDPDLAGERLHNLGIARILAGERAAGTADLRRALALEPDNQQTREALRELGLDPNGREDG